MHFNRPSAQQKGQGNRVTTSEYEIKTFTRARSPAEQYSQNFRRSPMRGYEQGTSESALGEMIYIEPNETNFRRNQNMSPLNDSRNILRSPGTQVIRNEYGSGGVVNMSQQINYSQIPRIQQANVEIESRKDRFSRSPKTINLGESPQEMEYNLRTLNRGGKVPKLSNSNSPQGNFAVDRSYNMMSNETGNIFLDQPMQQGGYVQQTEPFNSSTGFVQGAYEKKNYGGEQNSREIQFAMNPRDYQEPVQGILRKVSPKANVEGDSDSGSEKNDNVNQIKDLKTQLDRSNHVAFRTDDGMAEANKPVRNDIERVEDVVKIRETQDNVTGDDVKKLLKYYVKTYDPRKGEDGNLISNKQTIIQSTNDQLFNDRYKVLQKMNKLSSILLAKNRNQAGNETLNRSMGEDERKKFDKSTLDATVIGGKRTVRPKRQNKFLYVSLAMLSAKGPNVEDRTILRRMRLDKGGVVDLAQEGTKNKNKFKIVKARVAGRGYTTINPKYREKAARIVQQWWRERKEKYKKILDQIVKIQSVWRGKFTRKYVYDIIYISYLQEKFFAIMRSVLVNHIRPYVFNELFSKKKLVKDTLGELLEKNDERYTMLRIRPYFLKWYEISQLLKQRIIKSKDLLRKKEDETKKTQLLKKYFDEWALRTNLYKYIGKAKDAEEKKQKFFGTLNIVNGLTNITKRQVYKNTKEPIENYLRGLLKKKLLVKIVKNTGKKCLNLKKRIYFTRWKDIVYKEKFRDFKGDIFNKNIAHVDSRMDKIKMKYYFDRWRRQVPKARRLLDINDGMEILKRFTFRTTYIDPLNAFSEKCDIENMKQCLLQLLKIKARNVKDNLRDYFIRWRNKNIRIKDKNDRNKIYKTMLKNIIDSAQRRLLYQRFSQWRQRPKVNLTEEMTKINKFTKIVYEVFRNYFKPEKENFVDRLDKTRDIHALLREAKKMYRNYKLKSDKLKKYYFYKWRSQAKNDEISDLHLQLLKYLVMNSENKNNKKKISRYFTRWRLFCSEKRHYDNLQKLKQALKGADILNNIYNRRGMDLLIRLYRKMGQDFRPRFLLSLSKRLNAPRSSVRECLDRWRRIMEQRRAIETITSIKSKLIQRGVKNIQNRTNRDKLMKAYFQWKACCLKPEDYYPNLNKGLEIINKYFKKNLCEEPFSKILISRNFTRPLIKIINNYKNQENRLLNGKLRNLFGRWRKIIGDENVKALKTTIIYKTRTNLENNQKAKLLTKYFTRWKLYRRKGLDVNFGKGINMLTELFKRPVRQDIVNAFKTKIYHVSKKKAADELAKLSDDYKKHILHNSLMKWWRKAMGVDVNRMKKIKTRLRRIIKHNEIEPTALAFHKWANKIKIMQLRDKDMLKAEKMITNALRNNDKMNLNGAMSRWKKQIQLIREQYLKSLLVKQIKSSQKVKEEMNNQARLRAALLKWRANLIPIDYLDRLKQIRKGCKLFKLGLKKIHEKNIFNNIEKLAKETRKRTIIKDVIKKIIPKIFKYRMKRSVDIWVSKLGDTQRMKNKLKLLVDDYLYSDKIHDGLFTGPKEQIIEAIRNYDSKKREGAQKITVFINRITKIPKNIDRLKATLKLTKVFNNKEKALDDIKKMQFIRFYRQTQKVKNDQNARIIQKFIKEKLRKYFNKKDLVNRGLDVFIKYIKKKIIENINKKAKDNLTKKVLINGIKRITESNRKVLKNKITHWEELLPILRRNDAAVKIQNAFRTKLANKKLADLKLRLVKLKILHQKFEDKNAKIRGIFFHEWLHRTLMIKNKENSRIIQRFCRMNLRLLYKHRCQEKLKKLFKKSTKHHLAIIIEKSSHIIGGKGEFLYKTLQDIIYKIPFDKFTEKLKWVGKVNTLAKVQPKIHDSLVKYFLPLALNKWKHNTYDATVKYTEILQKFLRDQYEKKMKRDKERREILLYEFFKRIEKNNLYKLQLPFNIWSKKVKLRKVNDNTITIQKAIRKYLARKRANDLKIQKRYRDIAKFLIIKDISKYIKQGGKHNNLQKKKRTILIKILKEKIVTDGKLSVQACMDKWRNYANHVNDLAKRIQIAFRIHKAIKEKNRLKRIKILLEKIILKHIKTDNDQKRSKTRKWINKVRMINCNRNSRIIQHFIKPKLYKLLNDKVKKFFNDNAKKKTYRDLLTLAKLNKLQRALFRPSLEKFKKNLKTITRFSRIKEILKRRVTEKDNKTKELLIKKYIIKFKDKSDKIGDKMDDSASVIQRVFKCFKARVEKNRLLKLKKILSQAINKKSNITNNKLYSSFTKWMNKIRTMACNENARIIQKFCRGIEFKVKRQKELTRKLKIQNGIEKLFSIKFGSKNAFDKIKSKSNRIIITTFYKKMQQHRKDSLKDVFDKIKKRAFDNKLKKLIKISDDLKERIFKKIITSWKDNANKLARKRLAELIQKNFRLFLQREKQKNKKQILKIILTKLTSKYSDIKDLYFRRWNDKAQKMKINGAKQRAAKYIAKRYKISEARKKWDKLSKNILLKNRNGDLFEVIDRIKILRRLEKFKNPFTNIAKKTFFDKLNDTKRKANIISILIKILPSRNEKNNEIILKTFLKKWIEKANNLRKREYNLENILEIINRKSLIRDIDTLSKAYIIKKLFHDIPLIRAKDFIEKLRKIKSSKNKYTNLVKELIDTKDNITNINKILLMKKVLKLYAYKKVNGMLNVFNNIDKRIQKKNKREFLIKLLNNKLSHSEYDYGDRQESSNKPKTTKFKFINKTSKSGSNIIGDKVAPIKKCLPSFINYLEGKIRERNSNTLDRILEHYRAEKFCKLLKKYNNRTIEPSKEHLIYKMKKRRTILETQPIYKIKLFKIFRKKFIKTITTTLQEPSRLYKLFYLINLTKMHKNIATQRFFRELIRKWRFISFTKKMARKKLELMYKNLHASYMQMADEIFGDDEVNPSVIKEFERFGTDVGMFTGQEPEAEEENNRRYYQTVDKKYVFATRASGKIEKTKTVKKKYEYQEEEEQEVVEDIQPQYSSGDINKNFSKIKKEGLSSKYFQKQK